MRGFRMLIVMGAIFIALILVLGLGRNNPVIHDFITGLGLETALSIVVVLGVLLIIALLRSPLTDPKYNPSLSEEPYPRRKKTAPWQRWFSSYASWKSGIYGPREMNVDYGPPAPYLGHHLLSADRNKAKVRSDIFYYKKKFLWFFLWGIFFTVGAMIVGQDYLKYQFSGKGSCIQRIDTPAGEKRVYVPLKKNVINYFYWRYCLETYAFYSKKREHSLKNDLLYFLNDSILQYLFLLIPLFSLLYLTLKPAPAPILFDRKNRLVYTKRKGKLYIADWQSLAISQASGTFGRLGMALQLFTLDKHGQWKPRWFTLAAHPYYGEPTNGYMTSLGLNPFGYGPFQVTSRREQGQRAWLLRYMEQGPHQVHPVLPAHGLWESLSPIRQKLPGDIEAQVVAELEKTDQVPKDKDLGNVAADFSVRLLLKAKKDPLDRQQAFKPALWQKVCSNS